MRGCWALVVGGLLSCASVVSGQVLAGPGVCGITKTYAVYEARLFSEQVFPPGAEPSMPHAIPYTSAQVVFTPTYFDMTLRGSTYSHYAVCRFHCMNSLKKSDDWTTVISVHKAELLDGDTRPFECLPPNQTNEAEWQQVTTSIIPPRCGEDVFTGRNHDTFFGIETHTFTKPGRIHDVTWVRNMTFLSPVNDTERGLQELFTAKPDLDDYERESARTYARELLYDQQQAGYGGVGELPLDVVAEAQEEELTSQGEVAAVGANPTPQPTPPPPTPFLTCKYGVDHKTLGTAHLKLWTNLRAPKPKWGIPEPYYARDGFILVMFLIVLFASGWILLFWLTREFEAPDPPGKPDAISDVEESETESESEDEDEEYEGESKAAYDGVESEGSSEIDEDEEEDEDEYTDDDDSVPCRHCGEPTNPEDRVCGSCGKLLVVG